MHISFIGSICTFKYNHLIEPGVEGQKVASHTSKQKLMKVQFLNQTNGTNLKVIGKSYKKLFPFFSQMNEQENIKVHLIEIK